MRSSSTARTRVKILILLAYLYGVGWRFVPTGWWEVLYFTGLPLLVVVIADLVRFQSFDY